MTTPTRNSNKKTYRNATLRRRNAAPLKRRGTNGGLKKYLKQQLRIRRSSIESSSSSSSSASSSTGLCAIMDIVNAEICTAEFADDDEDVEEVIVEPVEMPLTVALLSSTKDLLPAPSAVVLRAPACPTDVLMTSLAALLFETRHLQYINNRLAALPAPPNWMIGEMDPPNSLVSTVSLPSGLDAVSARVSSSSIFNLFSDPTPSSRSLDTVPSSTVSVPASFWDPETTPTVSVTTVAPPMIPSDSDVDHEERHSGSSQESPRKFSLGGPRRLRIFYAGLLSDDDDSDDESYGSDVDSDEPAVVLLKATTTTTSTQTEAQTETESEVARILAEYDSIIDKLVAMRKEFLDKNEKK